MCIRDSRQTLWNAVEQVERGKKAQLAYSFEIALQNELDVYKRQIHAVPGTVQQKIVLFVRVLL